MDIAHTAAPVSDMSAKPGEHQGASGGTRVPVASARRTLQVDECTSHPGSTSVREIPCSGVARVIRKFQDEDKFGGGEVGRLRCLSESQEDGAPWALLPRRGGRLRGQGTGPRVSAGPATSPSVAVRLTVLRPGDVRGGSPGVAGLNSAQTRRARRGTSTCSPPSGAGGRGQRGQPPPPRLFPPSLFSPLLTCLVSFSLVS